MECSLARKSFIITSILHMPWNQDDVIGYTFIFRIHLSGMKNLCVLKRIIWKLPLPGHGVGKPASLGTLPLCKQCLRKPLLLYKIACVSTVNADTPHTVTMHQAPISKWTRVCHYVHFRFCIVKNMLMLVKRLVIMPQYAFLIHLRGNVRVTLSTHTHSFTWSRIWVELRRIPLKVRAISAKINY